jgi:uncharacterized membrane protein YkoI
MNQTIKSVLAALAMSAAAASPGLADRAPTADERAKIEQMLRSEGFTSWDEIELDDDGWEVDDAKGSDGREYELKLDRNTLRIIKRDPD